jgi:cytochrome c553
MRAKLLTIAGLVLAVSGVAHAQGDPVAGERKAETCMGCHGVEGYRNGFPSYHVPKLGGQHAAYIVSALQAYASGARSHDTMQAQARGLSEQDMQDIAAYFSQAGGDE